MRRAGQNRLLALNYIHQGEERLVCSAHEAWGERFQLLFTPLPPLPPPPRPHRTSPGGHQSRQVSEQADGGSDGQQNPFLQLSAASAKLEQQQQQRQDKRQQQARTLGGNALMQQVEAPGGGSGGAPDSPVDRTPTMSPDSVLPALHKQPSGVCAADDRTPAGARHREGGPESASAPGGGGGGERLTVRFLPASNSGEPSA